MDKVLIVGTKDVMEPTINALHEMDLLHIEDYVEEEAYFKIGKPLKSATSLSEKLLKIRSIRSYLGTKEIYDVPKDGRQKVLTEIDQNLSDLESKVSLLTSEKSAVESELKDVSHKEEVLKPYEALGLRMELLSGYENVAVFTGTVPDDVEQLIKPITTDYEYFSAPYGKGKVIALFVPKTVAPKVSDTLLKNNFVEVEQLRESGEPSAIRKSLEEREATLKSRLDSIDTEIKGLNEKYAKFLLSSEELLTIDTQKAEAPLKFATSDNSFVVEGWVPKPEFEKLKDRLSKVTNDKVYVTVVEPVHKAYDSEVPSGGAHREHHHEVNAPVKYNNPKYMYPAEAFIDLYQRPKYDEIDPTAIFFVLFPLFFGLILGDIAYGAILMLAAFYVRSKMKHNDGFKILANLLILSCVWTIFFGFLFGEFLGFSLAHYYPAALHHLTVGPIGPFSIPVERMMAGGLEEPGAAYVFGIKDLLVLTCIIGVAHIMLGYIIGFRNELKHHGLKMAILHKVSWMCIMLGGVAMVWYAFPLALEQALASFSLTAPLFLVGAILFVLGVILLLMGEGVIGIIEIPTLLSNTLSYTRLLAVGLSGVGIAFAVNTMVALLMPTGDSLLTPLGIIGLIGAIIVFLLGHTLCLVLGVIAPGLHAMRLHYVEFFQKFYKGGGRLYSPFGYNRKYTEE